jgi:hypothetical protein
MSLNGRIEDVIPVRKENNMADDIDAMLRGDETPAPTSQVENGSQIDAPDEGSLSEEEVEFNKLTGSTQERIKKLVRDKREAMEKLSMYENAMRTVPPPPPTNNELNPDVQQAVQKLSEVGIATDEKVDAKIAQTLSALRYEQEMARLASIYTGADNKPAFDRAEYEEFIRENPVYANYYPEDTFRMKMFPDEFANSSAPEHVSAPKTLKPTRTSQNQETFTPEYIEEKLKSLPVEERKQWYIDNLSEINATLSKMRQS